VSLWSNDWLGEGIGIGVGTREIAVGPRASRWVRLRKAAPLMDTRTVAMPPEQCYTESGVFDALRAAFEREPDEDPAPRKNASSRNRSAHIVLDDFWANHAILRGDFRTLRAREIDELARAHFVDTYDAEAEAIVVRICVQRGGLAAFACALPRTLVEGVRDAGASAGVTVRALKLCLPEMVNRALGVRPRSTTMLAFVTDALLQAVLVEANGWVGYDAQRLFADDATDPTRIAALVEQAFERCAERTDATRQECALILQGFDIDPEAFEARFASVAVAASRDVASGSETRNSFAHRLLEYAQ
jgi:hypothetical protein